MLSLQNGFAAQPGVANPLAAGHGFVLLKDSLEAALTKGGFRPPPGMSPIKGMVSVCAAGQPDCRQAYTAIAADGVAGAKTDVNGKAQFPAIPAGTYYLFGTTRYNNVLLLWNLKVDVKPGQNSVTLDQRNAASLN